MILKGTRGHLVHLLQHVSVLELILLRNKLAMVQFKAYIFFLLK